MMNKREAYEENVDRLLVLMNQVKNLGDEMEIEDVAKMMDLDLNNLQFYNVVDLMLIASVNETYANNKEAFEKVVHAYNNRVGA